MPKVKTPKIVPEKIRDRKEADAALKEIAEIQREKDNLINTMNDAIDQLKAEVDIQIKSVAPRLQALELGLASYANKHRTELFKSVKSV